MEVKDKRILVVGLGKSGAAAALFLEARGARVTVSDSKPRAQLGGFIPQLLDKGIAVETGVHGERTFRDQDLIVVSPGVPVDAPSLAQARQLGIKIIGEALSPSPVPTGRRRPLLSPAKSWLTARRRSWSGAISGLQSSNSFPRPFQTGGTCSRSRVSSWKP
jgi:Mur ligase MurD-like, N-terminal domain/NAD(P)-binding Rossmann-like domain